ncbi:MAG: ISNCY family transposase [Candidatus Acidiferrales bacterium]
MCQGRLAARSNASACPTTQIALSARRRGGSGTRQPRAPQPSPPAAAPAGPHSAFGPHHLRRLQRPSPPRKTGRAGRLLPRPRDSCRLLRAAGIASPRKRRAPAHRQRRMACAREGEMLLLDGSLHRWLEERGPQLTLLGFLDDATRKVLVAEFFFTEDAHGYFRLLRRLLRRCGVPLSFYGDRHSVFVRNDDHWSVEEQLAGRREPTQFGRALEQLGVTYIAARSPQAKGRIERLWGTFQDRLTSELRLAGANDLDAANQVLRRFLPDYNRRFARASRDAKKAWGRAPENLERICCFHHQRSVSNDNVVQWDGRRFQIPPQPQRFSFAGAQVQLHESLDGKVSIYYANTKLRIRNGEFHSGG